MTSGLKRNDFFLTGFVVFALLATACLKTKKSENSSNSNSTPTAHTSTAKTTTYQNSSTKFSGTLDEYDVDFSFDYPSSWERDEKAGKGSSPNFVKIERKSDDEVTLENFAVGYFTGQADLMPQLAEQLNKQLAGGFPQYKKVSEGPTRVGNYEGYEFRFTSHSTDTARGDLDIWGRTVLIPGNDDRRGAVLLMIATSASDQVKGVNDVGSKGELPIILNSFRFAKP
jgi:hypothetical protein